MGASCRLCLDRGGAAHRRSCDDRDSDGCFTVTPWIEADAEYTAFVDTGKKWRLMLIRTHEEGWETIDGPRVWTVAHIVESRPLIEANARLRIRARPLLPGIATEVARLPAVDPEGLEHALSTLARPTASAEPAGIEASAKVEQSEATENEEAEADSIPL